MRFPSGHLTRRRNPSIQGVRLKKRGSVTMGNRWWRLFLAGAFVTIVLCLATLEIVADRASQFWTMAPATPANVPGHP